MPLREVSRLVASSQGLVLLVAPSERLLAASEAARNCLGLARPGGAVTAREVLGVGWRELELVAGEGLSDLVVDLPARPSSGSRIGWRVRPERVLDGAGLPVAVAAFLEEPASLAAGRRRAGGGAHETRFDDLFGQDPRVATTKLAAQRFAQTRLPILLLAETGTGKDLLARAIHFTSPRRERPFVAINCGALSPHLLESELFGYGPGAFTDARREGHEGKIGAARGGTLFLDEVAEMPGPLQALLLRVLEDGTYYRVGENVPRQADVRLICATCRDLPRMVEEGSFRQDLYYRIAGACLSLPPVRERIDVKPLVQHVLARLGGRAISPAALDHMAAEPWPGNVRQIKTALQYALALAEGEEIAPEHLPPLAPGRSPAPRALGSVPEPQAAPSATLAEQQAELVRRALADAGGNHVLAARRLGIARSTLYRTLKRAES